MSHARSAIDVLGAGRIGGALHAAWSGRDHVLIRRDEGWDTLGERVGVPLIVTVRNDALAEVLDRVPTERADDVVLIQNGMLRTFLAARGLDDITRGVLFFAVASRGDAPVPGGTSPLCGPHADRVAQAMCAVGLPAAAVDPASFKAVELEKLLWNSIFGLLGQAFGEPVGASAARAEVTALTEELSPLAEAALGVRVDRASMVARMRAYSRSIPHYQASVREWPWRNGWFVAEAERVDAELPLHAALWQRAQ